MGKCTEKASTKQHKILHWKRMKATLSLIVAISVLAGIVSSHPSGKGYGEAMQENQIAGVEARTSCSIDDLLKCQEEINRELIMISCCQFFFGRRYLLHSFLIS